MVNSFIDLLREYPQIVIFLAIAIGYYVGKIKFLGFNLGSTAGVLLTSLALGQIGIQVSPLLKAVGFALFIFAIGYKVGPQFFGALKKEGLKYIWLSLFVSFAGLFTAIILAKLFGFDKGTAAGLLGGAMTQSSIIGTADGAIKHLPGVSSAAKAVLEGNVAIAYAITYIFGTAGLIVFFKLAPRLMGINLKEAARKLETEMSGGSCESDNCPELFYWYKRINLRAYQVKNTELVGQTIKQLEAIFPAKIAVEKIKRGIQLIEVKPELTIQLGDIIALAGPRQDFLKSDTLIGPEVDDNGVINLVGETLKICVTNKNMAGKTLGEISEQYGHGCFLQGITRQEHSLPLTKNTLVHKCDVLQVTGTKEDVENMVKALGYPERSTSTTDLVVVGWGCFLGTLLGLIAIPVMGIPITLGIGGGILVAGLIFGWLRAVHPTFGQIPGGAQWIFTDLGLNLFIASVGLSAGAQAFQALQTTGLSIFFAGVILSLVPMITGLLFGLFILKLNPVLLFGALTGAGTITAALNGLKEDSGSSAPALGYTVPYAFSNVILTIWGSLLINII
ncbi:MAG: aspartate-alanine antiporter [bacterium]